MLLRRLLLVVSSALAFVCGTTAHAQVRGQVVDSNGHPVAGARVELWSPLRRLSAQESGPGGLFAFPAAADSATGVIASRIGYATRSVPVAANGGSIVVVLSSLPVELQRVVVRATAGRLCPNRDEADARALWAATAARYESADTLFIGSSSVRLLNEVDEDDVGTVDESRVRASERITGPQRRAIAPAMGYGFRLNQSWREEFAGWQYFEIGAHFAQHFTDPSFGTYNSLQVRARGPEGTVLSFCSRGLGRQAVAIEGTLTIGPDTAFVSVAYRFRAPRPEDAGGQVTFVPRSPDGPGWLVPAESLYWRRIAGPGDRFVQLWERFDGWVITREMQDVITPGGATP